MVVSSPYDTEESIEVGMMVLCCQRTAQGPESHRSSVTPQCVLCRREHS